MGKNSERGTYFSYSIACKQLQDAQKKKGKRYELLSLAASDRISNTENTHPSDKTQHFRDVHRNNPVQEKIPALSEPTLRATSPRFERKYLERWIAETFWGK